MVRGVGFEPTQASAIGVPTLGPEPDPFDLARAPPPTPEIDRGLISLEL